MKKLAISLLLTLFIGGCHASSQTPLYLGFTSGMSESEFSSLLISLDSDVDRSETKGPYTIKYMDDIIIKGEKCSMIADFFNDELVQISLYPRNYSKFTKLVFGKSYKEQEPFETISGNLSVRNAGWSNAEGVTWRDVSRYKDIQEWAFTSN